MILAVIAGLVVFFPFVLIDLHALRPVVVIIGFAIAITELNRRSEFRAVSLVIMAGVAWTPLILFLSTRAAGQSGDAFIALNLQRGLVLLPLFVLVGSSIYKSDARYLYMRSYIGFALLSSLTATAEHFLGRSVLGRTTYFSNATRDGQIRGLAGAEHVLVLGTLICIAIPFVLSQVSKQRILVATILLVGCWSTGSLGPTATGVLVFLACVMPSVRVWLRKHQTSALWGLAGALVVLAYLSTNVWSTTINDATGRDYSTGYRFALYSTLPTILASDPFGVGIGTLPVGVWQFARSNFVVIDLSRTVDSEFVHLGIMFGYAGLAIFVGLLVLAIKAMRSDFPLGLALGTSLAIGFVLSIHSWDSLGPVWYALIGGSYTAVRQSRRRDADVHQSQSGEYSARAASSARDLKKPSSGSPPSWD